MPNLQIAIRFSIGTNPAPAPAVLSNLPFPESGPVSCGGKGTQKCKELSDLVMGLSQNWMRNIYSSEMSELP